MDEGTFSVSARGKPWKQVIDVHENSGLNRQKKNSSKARVSGNRCNISISRADMCFNCSLSVKSMKFGMIIVFKALKKIGYDAIAKKAVKSEK